MPYPAVIFDLDGTLLNTLEDLADSMNSVLAELGYPTHPVAAYKTFVGDGMEMLVRRTLPTEARNSETIQAAYSAARAEYDGRWAVKTRPYLGIPELLEELKKKQIALCVLSNKPHENTRETVRHFFASGTFEVVLGLRPSVPKKPHPAGAINIAGRLGLAPAEILYVGDTNTDMQTATAAGMFAAGVLWGFRNARELRENGADVLIEHPRQLLELVC